MNPKFLPSSKELYPKNGIHAFSHFFALCLVPHPCIGYFCCRSIRSCPLQRSFCESFHTESSMALSALLMMILCWNFLPLFKPFGSHIGDRREKLLEAYPYLRHFLGCPCWILTSCAVSLHYWFLSKLNSCLDPSACPQETTACLEKDQSFSLEMHSAVIYNDITVLNMGNLKTMQHCLSLRQCTHPEYSYFPPDSIELRPETGIQSNSGL